MLRSVQIWCLWFIAYRDRSCPMLRFRCAASAFDFTHLELVYVVGVIGLLWIFIEYLASKEIKNMLW
jgi:hypothetical protein